MNVLLASFSAQEPGRPLNRDRQCERVIAGLRSDFELGVVDDPCDIRPMAGSAAVLVFSETWVDDVTAQKIEEASHCCVGGTVVVVPGSVESLRRIASITVNSIVLTAEIETVLTAAVHGAGSLAWLGAFEIELGRLNVPVVVAAGLRRVARQALRGEPTVRSLNQLALGLGVGPDHLHRAGAAVGIDVRLLVRWFWVAGALRLRLEERTWERVALRMGYQSESGLSRAVHGAFQRPPKRIEPVDGISTLLARIMLHVLQAAPVRNADRSS